MNKILALLLVVITGITVKAQNFEWAKSMGGGNPDWGNSVAVDASGNVYTTGFFDGTVDFDPGAGTFNLTSAVGYDIFISKLDASGNFVWAKSIGGVNDDWGNSIAVDASGNVYTTGWFMNTADFDPGPGTFNLTTVGSEDIFICKLSVATTGFADVIVNGNVRVFPNPADNLVYIYNPGVDNATVVIRNQLGQEVFKQEMQAEQIAVDISSLSTGLFFLEIKNNQEVYIEQIIKR